MWRYYYSFYIFKAVCMFIIFGRVSYTKLVKLNWKIQRKKMYSRTLQEKLLRFVFKKCQSVSPISLWHILTCQQNTNTKKQKRTLKRENFFQQILCSSNVNISLFYDILSFKLFSFLWLFKFEIFGHFFKMLWIDANI